MEKALRLSGGTHTIEDVVEALRDGQMQAFWNDTSIVITEVAHTPRRQFVSIFLSAGDLDGVMALHDKIYDWAIESGYDFARILVRPGFSRLLERKGWKKRQTVMELELHGRQHSGNNNVNQQD
jgi:hypothetical protein